MSKKKLIPKHQNAWQPLIYQQSVNPEVVQETQERLRYLSQHSDKQKQKKETEEKAKQERRSEIFTALGEGATMARDARAGNVWAQQVRDLYAQGKIEEAQELAKKYAKGELAGLAIAGGSASSSLLGDLAVTGSTTTAETLIDGNTEHLGQNLLKNAMFDIIGRGFSIIPGLFKRNKNNIDYLTQDIPDFGGLQFVEQDPRTNLIPNYFSYPFITHKTISKDLPRVKMLGVMSHNNLDKFWGNEITRRLSNFGDVNKPYELWIDGEKYSEPVKSLIAKNSETPAYVFEFEKPNNIAGLHTPYGNNYLSIDRVSKKDPTLTQARHHEVVRHGTDPLVEFLDGDQPYKDVLAMFDVSKFAEEGSANSRELRATLGELMNRNVDIRMFDDTEEDFRGALNWFIRDINNFSDDQLLAWLKNRLRSISAYGRDYANNLTTENAKAIRELLKTAPAVAGLGYVINQTTDESK